MYIINMKINFNTKGITNLTQYNINLNNFYTPENFQKYLEYLIYELNAVYNFNEKTFIEIMYQTRIREGYISFMYPKIDKTASFRLIFMDKFLSNTTELNLIITHTEK